MDSGKCSCGRHMLKGLCPNCSSKAIASREKRRKLRDEEKARAKAEKVGVGSIAEDIFGGDRTADEAVEA